MKHLRNTFFVDVCVFLGVLVTQDFCNNTTCRYECGSNLICKATEVLQSHSIKFAQFVFLRFLTKMSQLSWNKNPR